MSHFSTVKTELRDRGSLLQARADLGHAPSEGSQSVRGYRGQTVTCDLAIAQVDLDQAHRRASPVENWRL